MGYAEELLGTSISHHQEPQKMKYAQEILGPDTNLINDEQPSNEKSFWESMKEDWPRKGGATIGGIIGGTPGAALGGAVGEAAEIIYEYGMGSSDAPQSSLEAAKRIAWGGAVEGATEKVGGIATKAVGKVLAPFSKRVTDEARIAMDTLSERMPKASWWRPVSRAMGRRKPALLPAEATEHRGLDILQNISEKSAIGSHTISAYKDITRKRVLTNIVDDLANSFGKQADPDILGDMITKTATGRFKDLKKAITNPLYNAVENMASGARVSTSTLKTVARERLATGRLLKGIEATNAGDDLMEMVTKLPDSLDYMAAKELRTRLISRIDEFSIANKKAPAIGVAKNLIEKLDTAIDDGLVKVNPKARDLWRETNRLYKNIQDKYNNRFIRGLVRKADPDFGGEPEAVLKSIFKKGGISGIRKTRAAIGDQNWQQLKGWYVRDLISQATPKGKDLVDGASLLHKMRGPTGMGEKALKEIFEPSELTALTNVATTLKVVQAKQGGGLGGMMIQLLQGGAVASLVMGRFEPAALTILLAPEVFARMCINPTTAKLLTEGLKAPTLSGPLALRLINAANVVQLKVERELEEQKDSF